VINEQGFLAYLYTSELQLSLELIDFEEYKNRLVYLYHLTKEVEHKKHLQFLLGDPIDMLMEKEGYDAINQSINNENVDYSSNGLIENDEKNTNDIYSFISKLPGCHSSKWNFHKGDKDFWPSVPHGHLINDINIKLDVYRGNTYDRRNKRRTKKGIQELYSQLLER
jgi:hypothetical protein